MKFGSLIALLFAFVVGCGGDETTPPPSDGAPSGGDNAALQDSWMFAVAQDPGRMEPFERGASGDAWLSFFHNDLSRAALDFDKSCAPSAEGLKARAAKGFACIGRARTHLELARLYKTSAAIDRVAQRQFFHHRRTHTEEVLSSVHQPFFEGLVLLHSGERDTGAALLEGYVAGGQGEPYLVALAGKITSGLGSDALIDRIWGGAAAKGEGTLEDLPGTPATRAYAARLAFIAAVASDDWKAAGTMFRTLSHNDADLREELQGSESLLAPTIHHHDPAFLTAMARYHALNALDATAGAESLAALTSAAQRILGRPTPPLGTAPSLADGIALVLFSPLPTPADLWAEETTWPDRTATIKRLKSTVPEFAKSPTLDLSDLDPFVNGSNVVKLGLGEILGDAGPAGANMNSDMGLAERFAARLLMERAWQYQRAFDVRLEDDDGADLASAGVAARSLFEFVLDKTPSPPNARLKKARISFRNDPPFLIDLARAHLDTRHPYDANEYVRPLTEMYPELIATREALTSLDSAWNPARKGPVR